jgi:hypothetical protein
MLVLIITLISLRLEVESLTQLRLKRQVCPIFVAQSRIYTLPNRLILGGAESSAVPQPTTSTAPSASSGKKSHAGAIAGGVIGGIVGLLLIAFLIYWLLRRRSRRQGPGPIYDEPQSENATTLGDSKANPYGTAHTLYVSPLLRDGFHPRPFADSKSSQDPNDPKSFPATMAQLTGSTHSFPSQGGNQGVNSNFTGARSALSRPNAQYSGVAEVM